jgi:hypothetical protein
MPFSLLYIFVYYLIRSLIKLLENAFIVPPESTENRYPEMIMKCLWKLTKMIGSLLIKGFLDLGLLLADIQNFLSSIPPMEWKSRAARQLPFEDMPLRTIKTIIHELTVSRGLDVLAECNRIFNGNQNYTWVYVKTFLTASRISIPEDMLSPPVKGDGNDSANSSASSKKRQRSPRPIESKMLTSSEVDDQLKDICGRICSKPDTRSVI